MNKIIFQNPFDMDFIILADFKRYAAVRGELPWNGYRLTRNTGFLAAAFGHDYPVGRVEENDVFHYNNPILT